MLGEPFFPGARFHQDVIRVIPPGEIEILLGPRGIDIPTDELGSMNLLWEQLPMLTSIFHFRDFDYFGDQGKDRGQDFWNSADVITTAIRDLGRVW